MSVRVMFLYRSAVWRLFSWLFLVAGIGACGERECEIVLLHTNDSHGSILAVDSCGGMAERAAFVRSVKEKNSRVLLVDAGDINTGQAISNMFDARPDIEAYNVMEYDAVTFGNHEFDKPLEVLLRQMQWANFPFISSNVYWQEKPLGKTYDIKEIDGVRVGIFGLTTKETREVSIYAGQLEFKEEIETARQMVQTLKVQKADLIIGLVHLGFTQSHPGFVTSDVLASQVEGIDILVDGHSHSYITKPKRVGHTWIVTANQSGRYVGMGKMKIHGGRLTDFEWRPVPIKGYCPDSVLTHKLNHYLIVADKDLKTVVGKAGQDFGLFQNGENTGRYGEAALGNLVADALKWKAGELNLQSDFALTNSGGIRQNLAAGEITKENVLAVLPFDNVLEVVDMTGKDLRRLFGFLAAVPLGNGAFAQISREVRVVYDCKAREVKELTIGGQPVVDTLVYRMATCDYIAAGKDGYDVALSDCLRRENTSLLLSDIVIGYIRMKGTVIPYTDGRITLLK